MNNPVPSDLIQTLARSAGDITLEFFRRPLNVKQKADFKGLVSEADINTENFIKSEILKNFPDHFILAEESSPELQLPSKDHFLWMIDPIDGTTNFVQGNIYYCVSIGLYKIVSGKAQPIMGCVLQPYTQDLYFAEVGKGATVNDQSIHVSSSPNPKQGSFGTGIPYGGKEASEKVFKAIWATNNIDPNTSLRINGAAALDMCRSAEGILNAFWEYNLSPWDMAAGNLIVREAGGVVSNFAGEDFDPLRDRNVVCGAPNAHKLLVETLRPIFT